jgi:hypothetical protein
MKKKDLFSVDPEELKKPVKKTRATKQTGKKLKPRDEGEIMEILLERNFDLFEYYAKLQEKPDPVEGKKKDTNKKIAYFRWLIANPTVRKPETQEEICKFFKIDKFVLSRWEGSTLGIQWIKRAIKRRMTGATATLFTHQNLLRSVARENLSAIQIYLKYYGGEPEDGGDEGEMEDDLKEFENIKEDRDIMKTLDDVKSIPHGVRGLMGKKILDQREQNILDRARGNGGEEEEAIQ